LASGTVVVAGGMSNQLAAAVHDLSDSLWPARLLADDPEAVADAHLAYFAAGADLAITAGYQDSFEGLDGRGVGQRRAAGLLALGGEAARDATLRARTARPLYVAASVGPYGAMLADGSEYRGRYGLSVAELERFHRPRMEI